MDNKAQAENFSRSVAKIKEEIKKDLEIGRASCRERVCMFV